MKNLFSHERQPEVRKEQIIDVLFSPQVVELLMTLPSEETTHLCGRMESRYTPPHPNRIKMSFQEKQLTWKDVMHRISSTGTNAP